MDKKFLALIIIGIIILVLIIFGAIYFGIYNGLIVSQQNVSEKWAAVEVQYQRRVDLIPNLVSTVKGAGNYEASTLTKITELRSQWQAASTVDQKVATANELESTLSKLLITYENYPQLTATQAYIDLTAQLEGTENRVAFARGEYNTAVKNYNIQVMAFPSNIVASMMGLSEKKYFESQSGTDAVVQVDFG